MKVFKCLLVPLLFILMLTNISAEDNTDIRESGTYFIMISVEDDNGQMVDREIRVLITTRNTVLNSFYNEAIDGVDLRYHHDDFFSNDLKELVRIGRVHAWDTLTGEKIPVIDVKVERLNGENAILTFSTKSKTKIALRAYKTAEGGLDLESTYFKPISKQQYNLSNTIQVISALVFAPFVALLISFLGTEKEYSEVNDTLFKQVEEKRKLMEN